MPTQVCSTQLPVHHCTAGPYVGAADEGDLSALCASVAQWFKPCSTSAESQSVVSAPWETAAAWLHTG